MHQALHLVCEALAFIVAYRYYVRLRRREGDGIADADRMWIVIGAAAGALLGSRLLGALEDPSLLAWDLRSLFTALNNRTIVGGLLGGLFAVELTKHFIGVRQRSGDLFVYPLILGMIIGRIGCAMAGLEDNTYGVASDLPWAMDLGDGVRRHPTDLYEILFLLFLWGALRVVQRRWRLAPGALFQLFLSAYLLFRLVIGSIKPAPDVLWKLGSIQVACVLGLLYYYRVWTRPAYLMERTDG